MLERMLLPFEYFTRNPDDLTHEEVMQVIENCFGENGAGAEIDGQIRALADLPDIQRLRYGMYEKNVETIKDKKRRDLYTVCTKIACGVYELSDCHHNTYRVIENQIYGIATGKMGGMPGYSVGAERKRLGQLLFGYALALDKWLLGQPMQYLLLDLGHVDLGFDPKNEILRVYAYLGKEKTEVKQWLAAALWCNLYHNPHGGLKPHSETFGEWHTQILEKAKERNICARDWMDSEIMIKIRKEEPADHDPVRKVNLAAFENGPEAALVDRLRASCKDYLAFVALDDETVVGHILFTPVTVDNCSAVGMGLAPMAVMPSYQRRGIGSQLIRHGLKYLSQAGCPFVIVLGHADYYPRFGFEPASKYRLSCQWEGVPDEAFMTAIFDSSVLPRDGGIARYRDEFDDAM